MTSTPTPTPPSGVGSVDSVSEWLLGRRYEAGGEEWERRVASTLWFTYRCGFAEMRPFGLTDDAGWGCCLRSSQMLMAEALVRHLGSRRRHEVVRWFFDAPGERFTYSLHNMVRCGARYDVMPGQWYGPGIAAHVLRDLCEMHDADGTLGMAMTVTSPERPLCEEDVRDAATFCSSEQRRPPSPSPSEEEEEEGPEETCRPEGAYDPLLCPPPEARKAAARAKKAEEAREARLRGRWRRALLIVVPLRLGLHKVEDKYVAPLLRCLSLPQSVGFVGGRPRQALYFVGESKKTHFVGLDPHVVQPCGSVDDLLSPAHLDSLVCVAPRKIPLDNLDPSLALGFYCRGRDDFDDLARRIKTHITPLSSPPLFDILDARPDDAPDAFLDHPHVSATTTTTGNNQQRSLCRGWDDDDDDDEHPGRRPDGDDDDDSEYVVV